MTREPRSQNSPRRGFTKHDTPPPWGVPTRRKPREQGLGRGSTRFYDPTSRRLFSSGVGEVSTQNRYSPLSEVIIEIDEEHIVEHTVEHTVEYEDGPRQEISRIRSKRSPRRVPPNEDRRKKNQARNRPEFSTYVNDDDYFDYMNKIKFSSWYFPEYIPYPCVDTNNVNLKSITNDINPNLNTNHYQISYKGNHTKQVFNRYNNQYFNKQYPIYKICRKFWKLQEVPPSCRIVADSSRIRTKENDTNNKSLNNKFLKINNNNSISNVKDKIKNNNSNNIKFINDINKNSIKNSKVNTINLSGTQQEEHTPQTPSCRIVASEVTQRSHSRQTTNPLDTQSCRIVANNSRIGVFGGGGYRKVISKLQNSG